MRASFVFQKCRRLREQRVKKLSESRHLGIDYCFERK